MSKLRYKTFSSKKAVEQAIDAAILAASSIREKLQVVLLGCYQHYLDSGDYTLINTFVTKIDELQGFNAGLMILHVENYMGLTRTAVITDEASGKTEMPKGFNGHSGHHNQDNAAKAAFIEAAKTNMWWDTKKEKSAFEDVPDEKIILAALKKIQKNRTNAEKNGVEHDSELSAHATRMLFNTLHLDAALIPDDAANEEEEQEAA